MHLRNSPKKGYVVDHINNEHNDCRISNLEFLKKDYNTAKGQQLDKDIDSVCSLSDLYEPSAWFWHRAV